MYTAHDRENYLIARKIKDEPVLPIGRSSDVKPRKKCLDRNIIHKSVMSIRELLIGRDELSHLVYQAIHEMEGIGGASAVEANSMDQLFSAALSVNGAAAL